MENKEIGCKIKFESGSLFKEIMNLGMLKVAIDRRVQIFR